MAQAVLSGLLIGGVYGLISMGLALVFGTMRFINFAHGDLVMVGMYLCYVLYSYVQVSPLLFLPVVAGAMICFALVLRASLFKDIERTPDTAQMFITVGLSLVLQNSALLLFKADQRLVPSYSGIYDFTFAFAHQSQVIAFGLAVVLATGLWAFLRFTDLGLSLRAVVSDREMAGLLGIRPGGVYTVGLGLGFALAGLGGAILVTYYPATPTVGLTFLVLSFVSVTLGGLSSVFGAFVGGLALGLVQQMSSVMLSVDLQNVIVFAVFVVVLLRRNWALRAIEDFR